MLTALNLRLIKITDNIRVCQSISNIKYIRPGRLSGDRSDFVFIFIMVAGPVSKVRGLRSLENRKT